MLRRDREAEGYKGERERERERERRAEENRGGVKRVTEWGGDERMSQRKMLRNRGEQRERGRKEEEEEEQVKGTD